MGGEQTSPSTAKRYLRSNLPYTAMLGERYVSMQALIESSIQRGDERFGTDDARGHGGSRGASTLKRLQKNKTATRRKQSKSEKLLSKTLFSPARKSSVGGAGRKKKTKKKMIKKKTKKKAVATTKKKTKKEKKQKAAMGKSKSTPHVVGGGNGREDLDCIGSAPTLDAAATLPNFDFQTEDLLAGEVIFKDTKVLKPHVTVQRGEKKGKAESAAAKLSHAQEGLIQSLARDIVLSKEKEWTRGMGSMPSSPGSMIHSLPSSLSPAVRRG